MLSFLTISIISQLLQTEATEIHPWKKRRSKQELPINLLPNKKGIYDLDDLFPCVPGKKHNYSRGEPTYPTKHHLQKRLLKRDMLGICQFPGGYMLNGHIHHSETTFFFSGKLPCTWNNMYLWFGNFPSSDVRLTIEISTYIYIYIHV